MSYQDQFMNLHDTSFHMVIRPCAKYGKLLLNQKKVTDQTRICTERRTASVIPLPPELC